jgi:hypothetical protein
MEPTDHHHELLPVNGGAAFWIEIVKAIASLIERPARSMLENVRLPDAPLG